MATPKKIKREIRARMERTGEAYTTARMAVLKEKGIDPKSLVEPKEKPDDR